MSDIQMPLMKDRFRGFLPVVVDIETGGFNCHTDALLEMAITQLAMNEQGAVTYHCVSRVVERVYGNSKNLKEAAKKAADRALGK